MSKNKILNKLENIFKDVFDDEDLIISPETTSADIDEWDSLNHIHLMIAIEKEFSVHFITSEVASLSNVDEFMDALIKKL